jgi:hypothetical protein
MPALIFDLDGTLVDTVYAHVFGWQRALAEADLPIDGWRIHRRIGMSGGLFTRAVARELGRPLTSTEIEAIQTRHRELFASCFRSGDRSRRRPNSWPNCGRRVCCSGSRPPGVAQRSTPRSRRSASVRQRSWSSAVMSSGQSPNRTSFLPARRNSPSPRGVLRRRRCGLGSARHTPRADAQPWSPQRRLWRG